MTKVYLASPFFNDHEIEVVQKIERILEGRGLNVFSPMRDQMTDLEHGTSHWSLATFKNDIKYVDWADIVVGAYHGQYSDSGTAWELGYAYGTNKPVIVVHVGEASNLMVHEGGHANITLDQLADYDFEKMPSSFYAGNMF